MRDLLPKKLQQLALCAPAPVYIVGGFVRDFLAKLHTSGKPDIDICAPIPVEEFVALAQKCDMRVNAVYKTTGTVKFSDSDSNEYEYARFRSDTYVRGVHTPVEIAFTSDIALDARRRDFTVNAIYYDIQADRFVDPLGGIPAVYEKRLTTVADAKKVFGEDGLRLLRLCRQAAQLGFYPDEECLRGAIANASLIQDIVPERIFTELSAILLADKKYGVANGHYQGVLLLDKTRVLDYILPDLALGRDMAQRNDFHNYDVLNHSLRAVLYADERVRFAALLHDIGKPLCQKRDNNSFSHAEDGADLSATVLTNFKAPKKLIERTSALVRWHMYDFNVQTKENKLRRFFVEHYEILEDLLLLKQADYSACKDSKDKAPTCARWETVLARMREENAPLSLKQLAVNGNDLIKEGFSPRGLAELLRALLLHAAVNPLDNEKTRLIRLAHGLSRGAGTR